MDTLTFIARITLCQRTSYPKPFKAQVVQEALPPGVSVASVALRHGLNANLVRKWIRLYRHRQVAALPAFVPLAPRVQPVQPVQPATVRLDVPFGQQTLSVQWPSADPDGCARLIRGRVS